MRTLSYRLIISSVVLLALIAVLTLCLLFMRRAEIRYGATLSFHYTEQLGLDWRDVLRDSERTLGLEYYRVSVHWNLHEEQDDEYDFEELDELFDYADRENLKITLAIGQKVPRWPECFTPHWAEDLAQNEYEDELLEFVAEVVTRYADRPSLHRWQVENEAYFQFGDCRNMRPDFERTERNLVKSLVGDTPIQTTVSGEQGLWFTRAFGVDIIGTSLYRTVSNPGLGTWNFPQSPFTYRAQASILKLMGVHTIISELQAEPWGVEEFNLNEQYGVTAAAQAFGSEDLQKHVDFAVSTGMREIYFWGLEWWYVLQQKGEADLWNEARRIISN